MFRSLCPIGQIGISLQKPEENPRTFAVDFAVMIDVSLLDASSLAPIVSWLSLANRISVEL